MEFVVGLTEAEPDPVVWAQDREEEGWDLISCPDHFNTGGGPFPHLWVTLTAMAMATDRIRLTSAFANCLFRSPVETAQATLQLHRVSGGRFELGLGAGWAKDEVVYSGLTYPSPGERATLLRESVEIVRLLLDEGTCDYDGEIFNIRTPELGPAAQSRIDLIASVGGNRTTREVAPLVDRVAIFPIGPQLRGGELDFAGVAAVTASDVQSIVDRVRDVRADVPLSLFCFCSAGDDEETRRRSEMMKGGFFESFFGEPKKVAESLMGLADMGIDRVDIGMAGPATYRALAPVLF